MALWNCRRSQLDRIEDGIRAVLDQLQILQEIKHMAANAVTQQQFGADLGKLQADVTTMVATLNSLDVNVKQLKADVAALKAANPGTDFSSLDATVNQMDNTITTANANVQAEVPNPDAPPADGSGDPNTPPATS